MFKKGDLASCLWRKSMWACDVNSNDEGNRGDNDDGDISDGDGDGDGDISGGGVESKCEGGGDGDQ